MKKERLGITMLINDKSQLKRNVKQIGFQLAHETSKSLSWSDRLRYWASHPKKNVESIIFLVNNITIIKC